MIGKRFFIPVCVLAAFAVWFTIVDPDISKHLMNGNFKLAFGLQAESKGIDLTRLDGDSELVYHSGLIVLGCALREVGGLDCIQP